MHVRTLLLLVSVTAAAHTDAAAQTWEQAAAPSTFNYPCIACSADGTTLFMSGFRLTIPIYISTNRGDAWTMTSAPQGTWASFALSADKTKVAAVNYGPPGIYTSADGGISWISNNVPDNYWTSVAASGDGNRLVAVSVFPQTIFTSTNAGALWTQVTNAPLADWRSVASSADGTELIAVNSSPGTILKSSDAGTSWTPCTNAPTIAWNAVASSADGTKLVAAPNPGPVYFSADSGITWNLTSLPNTSWRSCAASADASTLIVCSQSGFIYTSTDSGATWLSNSVPLKFWTSVAASADGSRLCATADGASGGLWRFSRPPAPRMQASLTTGSFRLSWVLPSINFVPQHSPDCTPASWAHMTNEPILNLSNLQYSVALPMSERSFYRLKSQ